MSKEHGFKAVNLIAARAAHVNAGRAREAAECRAVLRVHALFHRGQGQRAVHQARVDEIRAQADGQRVPNRALARSRWAVDRDRQGLLRARAGFRGSRPGPRPRECADLGCREAPPLPGGEPFERHRPQANPHQPPDRTSDGRKEATYLPLAALPNPDPQPGSLLVRLANDIAGRWGDANAADASWPVLERDAGPKLMERTGTRGWS